MSSPAEVFVGKFNHYAEEMKKMFPKYASEIDQHRTYYLYLSSVQRKDEAFKSFQAKTTELIGAKNFDSFRRYMNETYGMERKIQGKRSAEEMASVKVEVPDLNKAFGVTVKRINKCFKVMHSKVPKVLVGDVITHLNDIRIPETTDSTVFAAWLNSMQGKFTISVERPTSLVVNKDLMLQTTKRVVYSVAHNAAALKRCVLKPEEMSQQKNEAVNALLSLSRLELNKGVKSSPN